MKFFVVIALFAAAASAYVLPAGVNLTPAQAAEVEEILAAIHSPSTDPTTAAMLEEMLYDLLGVTPVKPPINIPAIIDDFNPPHLVPEIIDFPLPEEALAPTPVAPAPPAPSSSPLVQIIVNVKQQGDAPSPVQVDQIAPSPVVVVEQPEIKPTPVIVVDEAGESIIRPTPVIVVDEAAESIIKPTPVVVDNGVIPEPVIVSPIVPTPIGLPEILN